MTGVVPLIAFDALGSKQAVSTAYILASIMALAVTLNVGTFERLVQRRWVTTTSVTFLFVSAMLLGTTGGFPFVVGIGLTSAAASMFSVCLSLYVMDYIGKQDLTRNESRRIVYNGTSWLLGPSLGLLLWQRIDVVAPFLVSAAISIVVLVFFWRLRLTGNPVLVGPANLAINPLPAIATFFEQRNLRVAYAITFVRSVFWFSLFVYGPIYVVEAGMPVWAAGALLSAAAATLFIGPVVQRAADRYGSRRVIMVGFAIIGANMAALGSLGEPRSIGILFWLIAAVGGATLDVLGNIPFMRLVKPRQRTAMTGVFTTWRETSALVTPLMVSVVLLFGPFRVFYFVLSALVAMTAVSTSYLPRRI